MEKLLLFLIVALISSCNNSKKVEKQDNYRLVWSDEFDTTGLPDTLKWQYDIGGHGWGNNELQFYDKRRVENARIENGFLIIEARKEPYMAKEYSSARLTTKGTAAWKYGKVEVRAKLPKGRGTWPAIWMLPVESKYGRWPACGEIDIMENVGFDPTIIHGTVHTKKYNHMIGTQKAGQFQLQDANEAFHSYSVIWLEKDIQFYIDNELYFTFQNDGLGFESWPFDQEFYLILNIAVGGNWGGQKGVDDSSLPWKMEVDYIRVFEKQ